MKEAITEEDAVGPSLQPGPPLPSLLVIGCTASGIICTFNGFQLYFIRIF